jgi:hypothetical protein
MKRLRFSIEIDAPRDHVWHTLWDDGSFRDWANLIDEGTYMVGELDEGSQVQWISASSGYGVTSMVEKLISNECVVFRHLADTKEDGLLERENEWTGGREIYSLQANKTGTTLTVELDTPPDQEETFEEILPNALARVKALAEDYR